MLEWKIVEKTRLDYFAVQPNHNETLVELTFDKWPANYNQLKIDLKRFYAPECNVYGSVVEKDGKKLVYYKVDKQAVEKLGLPKVSGHSNFMDAVYKAKASQPAQVTYEPDNESYKQKLLKKINELTPEIRQYYVDNTTDHSYTEDLHCHTYDSLTPLQIDGVNIALLNKQIVIGAAVGSGKTLLASTVANKLTEENQDRVLVITLKAVVEQWKEVLSDEQLGDRSDVINYEALRSLIKFGEDKNGKKNRRKTYVNHSSKYRYLLDNKYKIIILDEVHKCRGLNTDTTHALNRFLKLNPIEYRLGLSGTPLVNSPMDLLGILYAMTDHPLTKLSGRELSMMLTFSGGETAYKKFVSNSIWYRTLEDYHIELPKLNLQFVPVTLTEAYYTRYFEIIEKGRTMSINNTIGDSMIVNTATIELQKWATEYKYKFIKNMALGMDKPLVIMSTFNEVFVNPLSQELGVKPLTGGCGMTERNQIKKDFMHKKTKYFVANLMAAGTGTDGLQKVCDTMIIANPVWTIGDLIQTIARICRLGGPKEANIIMPYIPNDRPDDSDVYSIEEKMILALDRKKKQFDFYLSNPEKAEDNTDDLSDFLSNISENVKSELRNILIK